MKIRVLAVLALSITACSTAIRLPIDQTSQGRDAFKALTISSAASGSYPLGLAVGKLSRRQSSDLVIASWGNIDTSSRGGIGEGNISVLYGEDAKGRKFSTKDEYPVGLGASDIKIADLNGDGIPDIAVVATNGITGLGTNSRSPGQVWIYYGNGDGIFTKVQIVQSPISYPDSIAIADIDGNGYQDLVLGSSVTKAVGVLFGGPGQTFTPLVIQTMETSQSIALGRFRKRVSDKGLDIAVLGKSETHEIGEPTLSILQFEGNSKFHEISIPIESTSQEMFHSIAAGDFNHDGMDEIVVHSDSRISLYGIKNEGAPVFLSAYAGEFNDGGIAIADFDKDGNLDVVVPSAPLGLAILYGDGKLSFLKKLDLQLPKVNLTKYYNEFGNKPEPSGQLGRNLSMDVQPTDRILYDVADLRGNGYPDIVVVINTSLLSNTGERNIDKGVSAIIFKNRLNEIGAQK